MYTTVEMSPLLLQQEIRSMERASAQCVAFRMPKQVSCTEVGIYNGANSPNGFLTTAVV